MKRPCPHDRWSAAQQRLYQHDVQEMWDPSLAPHIWNMYHADLRMYLALTRCFAPRTILDIGCAQGTLALILAEHGYHVTAVDIRPEFLEYARSRYECGDIEFLCADALQMDLGRRFDMVFANQVIEHLIQPIDLLRHVHGFVEPNGHAVVTTPNHGYFKNRLPSHQQLGTPALYHAHHASADGDDHFYALTGAELVDYARQAGFRDVSVACYATPWITGHFKFRYLHRWMTVPLLRALDRLTLSLPGIGSHLGYQLRLIAGRGRV